MLNDTESHPSFNIQHLVSFSEPLRISLAPNACAEGIQSLLDPFVSPIDLMNIVDHALALRAKRGEQKRHTGANVGAGDLRAREPVAAHNDGAVRIAENDARAHLNQLVGEEEPRLKHL